MQRGDILFNLDSKVLHGRTSFSDAYNALPPKFNYTLRTEAQNTKRDLKRKTLNTLRKRE